MALYKKPAYSKKDLEEYYLKNIRTGELYVTCRALGKEMIDGVEFTRVLDISKKAATPKLIRSDSVKKVSKPTVTS
jgi:hypothetical protein